MLRSGTARASLAVVALALMLGSCSTTDDAVRPEVGELAASPSEKRAASPSPSPSALIEEEPPAELDEAIAEIEESGDSYPTSSVAWPPFDWPLVDVPADPTPRLAVTCDELLSASGATAARVITTPVTVQTIGVRQAGGTVCAFELGSPDGPAEALLLMAGDMGSPIGDAPVECRVDFSDEERVECAGLRTAGSGGATITYSFPPGTELQQGADQGQRLLDAAVAVLESEPALGPAPTVHPDSMGVGADGCFPTADQRELVFAQFALGQYPDVYGGSSGNTAIDAELNERAGVWHCWWWLGWAGVTVEVIPGGAWAVDSAGREEVTVLGAVAAYRTQREVREYRDSEPQLLTEIAIVASSRGSAIIVRAVVDEAYLDYFNDRLPIMAAAIIATQP